MSFKLDWRVNIKEAGEALDTLYFDTYKEAVTEADLWNGENGYEAIVERTPQNERGQVV